MIVEINIYYIDICKCRIFPKTGAYGVPFEYMSCAGDTLKASRHISVGNTSLDLFAFESEFCTFKVNFVNVFCMIRI